MDYIVIKDIKFKADEESILNRLHMDKDSEDYPTIQRLIREAEDIAKPKALLKASYIEARGENFVVIDNIQCTSRVLAVNLQNVNRVFPCIVTCGTELHQWARSIEDMVERFWADIICEAALQAAAARVSAYMEESLKVSKVSRMNPGSLKDWPLEEQKSLFKLLGNPKASIGVELTESCLMVPTKSVSGIIFETQTSFESCQLCPRENCPNRRAPYEKDLYELRYRNAL